MLRVRMTLGLHFTRVTKDNDFMIRGRKSYVLTKGLLLISLAGLVSIIVFVEPGVVSGFALLLFFSFFAFTLLFEILRKRSPVSTNKNIKTAAVITILFDGYLLLRVFRLDSPINIALFIASIVLLYIYLNS